MKRTKIDVLGSKRMNVQDLDEEIRAEVQILGALDIFTDAHVLGVTKTTTKICEEMEVSYEFLKHCVLCAYLHDVGKIKVPSEVLQKNGKLTEDEFKIMKMHTVYGYEICMEYPNFKNLAPIVRAHHESFDGSGYPDGLVGNQIPFEASIIKVADVYDALTQRRQYKEGYKQSQAIGIMLDDARKNRMSARIMSYLINYLLREVAARIEEHENNIEQFKEQLSVLHELETIYKSIYDRGYTKKSQRKLERYNLSPGYDMSTNANLLTAKQKALEKEREWLEFCKEEYKTLKKQLAEAVSLGKKEKWYPNISY